jgi:hypothetical protein
MGRVPLACQRRHADLAGTGPGHCGRRAGQRAGADGLAPRLDCARLPRVGAPGRRCGCCALGLVAAAGAAAVGLPAECLARCAALSNPGACTGWIARLGSLAGRRVGAGRRLRARPRADRAAPRLPDGSLARRGVELAAARAVCLALPLGPRSPGRPVAQRLAPLRHGVPVPAAREHAARRGQGARRAAARRLAGQPGIRSC